MNKEIIFEIAAPASQVVPVVEDIVTYPDWIDIVSEVTPDEDKHFEAYFITLKGRLGPISRSKKLRVIRDTIEPPPERTKNRATTVFSRSETHDREVAAWQIKSVVSAKDEATCQVKLYLYYGGDLWSGALEALLDSQTKDAATKLEAYVKAGQSK